MTPILTITLNPALDISTLAAGIRPGPKLRCCVPVFDAGGGGINISRAIRAMGGESRALVALGVATGARMADLMAAAGINVITLHAPGETRQSLAVTDTETGGQFRFVMPGPEWLAQDVAAASDAIASAAPTGGFVVLSGSQPPGLPDDFMLQVTARLAGKARLIADTSGAPLLVTPSGRWFCAAAQVPVVSKVGAGDSFMAGFVLALAQGKPPEQALAFGVAAASAAVMTPATELCRGEDAARLLTQCPVSPL